MSAEYALLGHPVSHSLSPKMFNTVFAQQGIDARYTAIDIPPQEDLDLRTVFKTHGLSGANLTVPHKTAVLPQLDALSEAAARAGAVNVVITEGGSLVGHNTDAQGFIDALGAAPGPRALILGAGGAARAIGSALLDAGVRELFILNRSQNRAAKMLDKLAASSPGAILSHADLSAEAFAQAAKSTHLVVNCTAGGARTTIASFDPGTLGAGARWMDINYWDTEPPGEAACRESGVVFQTGHSMLAHQAAHAFEIFTGRQIDGALLLNIIQGAG